MKKNSKKKYAPTLTKRVATLARALETEHRREVNELKRKLRVISKMTDEMLRQVSRTL